MEACIWVTAHTDVVLWAHQDALTEAGDLKDMV